MLSQEFIDSVREELLCSVCCLSTDLHILTACGHHLCSSCISKIATRQKIDCPECRRSSTIPRQGLPKHVMATRLGDIVNKHESSLKSGEIPSPDTEPNCSREGHAGESAPVVIYCKLCREVMCHPCSGLMDCTSSEDGVHCTQEIRKAGADARSTLKHLAQKYQEKASSIDMKIGDAMQEIADIEHKLSVRETMLADSKAEKDTVVTWSELFAISAKKGSLNNSQCIKLVEENKEKASTSMVADIGGGDKYNVKIDQDVTFVWAHHRRNTLSITHTYDASNVAYGELDVFRVRDYTPRRAIMRGFAQKSLKHGRYHPEGQVSSVCVHDGELYTLQRLSDDNWTIVVYIMEGYLRVRQFPVGGLGDAYRTIAVLDEGVFVPHRDKGMILRYSVKGVRGRNIEKEEFKVPQCLARAEEFYIIVTDKMSDTASKYNVVTDEVLWTTSLGFKAYGPAVTLEGRIWLLAYRSRNFIVLTPDGKPFWEAKLPTGLTFTLNPHHRDISIKGRQLLVASKEGVYEYQIPDIYGKLM